MLKKGKVIITRACHALSLSRKSKSQIGNPANPQALRFSSSAGSVSHIGEFTVTRLVPFNPPDGFSERFDCEGRSQ